MPTRSIRRSVPKPPTTSSRSRRPRAGPPPLPASGAPPRLLNWQAVSIAGAAAVLVMAGVLAWVARHPPGRSRITTAASPAVAVVAAGTSREPAVAPPAAAAPVEPAAPEPEPLPAQLPAEPVLTANPAAAPAPVPAPEAAAAPAEEAAPVCDRFGTSVEFETNPVRAMKQAARTQKLLMVLHISGNFEDSGFT